MAMLKQSTMVVVADSEKALFLRNLTDHENPNFEVITTSEQEKPKTSYQTADRPGRQSDGGPGHKSALAESDWHQLAKARFAKDLADKVQREVDRERPGALVIAASPQVLGALRTEMHKTVADMVVADIPKTLTNHPLAEIETIIKSELDAL